MHRTDIQIMTTLGRHYSRQTVLARADKCGAASRDRSARPPPGHPRLSCAARTAAASKQPPSSSAAKAAISCEQTYDREGRKSVSCEW